MPAAGAQRQVIQSALPAVASGVTAVERLPGLQRLNLAIGLPLRNQAALTEMLRQIYDPSSPSYRHYLSPEQFLENFGPTEQDYQAVIEFTKSNGLTVTGTHPNRTLLDVSGSVADIERVFRVTMRRYPHPKEARLFFAPDAQPSLDFAGPVLQVSGLDDYVIPRPMNLTARRIDKAAGVRSNAGSGPDGTYMGIDFRAAYVPGVSLTGSGQSVGLVEFDGFYTNDITVYESRAGLSNVPLKTVLLDGFDGTPGFANVEVALDIEMAVSMAPGLSAVIIYEGFLPNDVLNRMATDNLAKQLSASWTYPINAGTEQIFQQFAAQGQSFFNASGDSDAYVDYVPPPTDDPYITIVGGTTLTTSGPGGSWVAETVWNWNNGLGTGGGISPKYTIPSWQKGLRMAANHGSTTFRNLPDVALTADNIFVIADNGTSESVGGTSAATPLWAGFMALVNQQAASNGKPPAGFINPAIYAIGKRAGSASLFHDIITGDNTSFYSPSNFYAVAGYDLCTGWGTPAGTSLINALAAPDALQISPETGFTAIGPSGGPFTVTSQSFTLTNIGASPLNWTLANTAPWLISASPSGGTLGPGGPEALVTVSLDAVSNLPAGIYGATLRFTNVNDSTVQNRQFTLAVIKPPSITVPPTNQAVLGGATAVFTVTAAGGLPLSYRWQANGAESIDDGNTSGSATRTLVISNVSLINTGAYTVVVSNAAGTVTSAPPALLTMIPSQPVIVMQPASQAVLFGAPVIFTVTALGDPPLVYQWQQNGMDLADGAIISGSASGTLSISAASSTSAGVYSVIVRNARGATPSSGAVLTVNAAEDVEVVQNGGFETGDFSFWNQFGNTLLSSVGSDGLYSHSGNFGAEVGPPGSLGYLSQAVPTTTGAAYLLSLWLDSPDGLGPNEFLVSWDGDALFDQTNLGATGWTNLQFIVTAAGPSTTLEFGFRDDASFLGLDEVSLKLLSSPDGAPVITAQPPAQTVVAMGATATIHVGVAGELPISYQWQFEGNNIADATNATLTLLGVTTNQTGQYSVLASNILGFASSSNGVLTVLPGSPALITFDDLAGLSQAVPAGYYGLSWENFYYLDAVNQAPHPSGFQAGMVSPNNVAYNPYGSPAALSSPWPFDLISAYLTAAWQDNLRVQVKGYAEAVLVSDTSYTLSATNPTLINLNCLGVTSVRFIPSGGKPHRGYGSFGTHFAMDNVVALPSPKGRMTTLYSFSGTDGAYPRGTLVPGADGNFYGTSQYGGKYGNGTVFRVTTNGALNTVFSFNANNGAGPQAALQRGLDGNFYGTTANGGTGFGGTVFKIRPNGAFTSLVSFNGPNGSFPGSSLVQAADGNLYGTTQYGGGSGNGTVFRITTNGALTSLASFNGANGSYPYSGLAQDASGVFYGTTSRGGTFGDGTVFRMTSNGILSTVVSFDYTNGSSPYAALARAADGSFYGTTSYGGKNGSGTVFRITTNGAFSTLAAFDFITGAYPQAALLLGADGAFYGTAESGGAYGNGSIFRVTSDGTLTGLISFSGGNGASPYAALTQGADGNFYGLTSQGGPGFNGSSFSGDGTVFRLGFVDAMTSPVITAQPVNSILPASGTAEFTVGANGAAPLGYFWRRNGAPIAGAAESSYTISSVGLADSGSQFSCMVSNGLGMTLSSNAVLTVFPSGASGPIHSFTGSDGGYPAGPLVEGADGNFYGTTEYGGTYGQGSIFRITTNGLATTLVSLNFTNGANPRAGLVLGADGNFYGTTASGGSGFGGTVFRLTANGSFTTLASLHYSNGGNPNGLVQGADGNLYGTTQYGGKSFDGTVFRISTNGTLSTLISFNYLTNGANPRAGLIQGADGGFYGTTSSGGPSFGNGTVFKMTTNGMLTVLATFDYNNGASPSAGLAQSVDGNFYGATASGGANGEGTIFRMTSSGALSTLVTFNYANGANPQAGLVQGSDGNFYGTTTAGGTYGDGILFRMASDGTITNLLSFAGTNGAQPRAALIQGSDGNFYGTTYYGGAGYAGSSSSGNGTVFRLAIRTVALPPLIGVQPLSQSVAAGGTASFSVKASGSPPLRYSWRRNGAAIAGASQASYTTNNVQLADSGSQFSCVVSNAYGSVTSSSAGLTVAAQIAQLVQNGGFETGDFTSWTQSGQTNGFSIRTTSSYAHSGQYGAAMGLSGLLGNLSQTLATSPGQSYLLSLWVDYPNGATPNEFLVGWNGIVLSAQLNLGAIGWTNLQFFVTATASNTVLRFGVRDDPSYLGLDDVRVVPLRVEFLPGGGLKHFSDGQFQFVLSGAAGFSYAIDVSTNLVNWTGLANITMTSPTRVFLDTTTSQPLRFYRVRLLP